MSVTVTVYVNTENLPDEGEDFTLHTHSDMEDMFRDMLDDCYGTVTIGGMEYDHGRALEAVDPIAFRCGVADYTSTGEWVELSLPFDVWMADGTDEQRDAVRLALVAAGVEL